MRLILALFMTAGLGAEAQAQGVRPESCARIATAQFDNCSVSNLFRCEGERFAFWIETLDVDGMLTIEARNADHGSLSVDYVGQDMSMRLTQSKAHPRDTLRNGTAEDRITGELVLFGMTNPISGETRYGHAGETTDLAGETFARIAFNGSVVMPPPMPTISGGGTMLYSEALDLLVEEEVRFDFGMGEESYRLSHLALPGQARFGVEMPTSGCGELSGLSRQDEAAT